MKEMEKIKKEIETCKKCGRLFGNSAIGFGKEEFPLIMFIGINPYVKNHKFVDGRGITILKEYLSNRKFTDYYFDNLVKCQMPGDYKPDSYHAFNCIWYLRNQIEILQPKNLILFGKMCQDIVINDPIISAMQIPIESFPHFSSIFYHGTYDKKEYYEKLGEVISRLEKRKK